MKSLRWKITFYTLAIVSIFVIGIAFFIFRWNIFNPLKHAKLSIGGVERKFYFHVPRNLKPMPRLIFVLHGSAMTASQMQLVTGHWFDSLADKNSDAIVVYPQGFKKYWNDCRKSFSAETSKRDLDDVEFFERMIEFFSKEYAVNLARLYVAGFSNGGHMTFRLSQERPDLFRGFAVISANLPIDENNDCANAKKPVSILLINGTADPVNPYLGGKVIVHDGIDRGHVISTQHTMRYYRNLTHCRQFTEEDFPDLEPSDHSSAKAFSYQCPGSSHKIKLIEIQNGGHNIPNPTFFLWPRNIVGNVNEDLNVPAIIFKFFEELK
ncbi:MAG: prolyl oligopeptidase family serine peptidase [Leptospira sp.]|nr:prolyl oligopeptidase family serine peptidase [Leptospira sp.]